MIRWHLNTTYDFFISLFLIHHPKRFALRASWAAGVRQRLDEEQRTLLEALQRVLFVPLHWIATLPDQGNVQHALMTLEAMTWQARFDSLFISPMMDAEVREALESLRRGADDLDEASRQMVRTRYRRDGRSLKASEVDILLDLWRRADFYAAAYLDALRMYQRVFFAEEETRILPYLKNALHDAQKMAEKETLSDLLFGLSRGVRLTDWEGVQQVILAPSFWSAPLIFALDTAPDVRVFVFGARPDAVNLVPGVPVPDELVSGLKALADATRLRILKSLLMQPATVTELAHLLRLRPPTVVHHLRILRLAGLVKITINAQRDRIYALRTEGLFDLQQILMAYLSQED